MILAHRVDGLVCDLDGVVYRGDRAVPGAVEALDRLDVPVVYATNNAARTPAEVAERLRGHGVRTTSDMVLTSSLTAARVLADELAPGTAVLAVGGPGVADSLRSVGLEPRRPGEPGDVAAVVQGYGAQVTADDLAAAAFAIQRGARWVATNRDRTLPTEHGVAPGNGSLVAAVRMAVDVEPTVIGKPEPPMYVLAARVAHGAVDRVLAVGDRLDTDIAGAVAAGMEGALVLTGVHTAADAAAAPPEMRPTYLLGDLGDLFRAYPEAEEADGFAVRGRARARVTDALEVHGDGLDAERAALDAVWSAVDAGRLAREDVAQLWRAGSVGRSRPKE